MVCLVYADAYPCHFQLLPFVFRYGVLLPHLFLLLPWRSTPPQKKNVSIKAKYFSVVCYLFFLVTFPNQGFLDSTH